jgi:replicative DNA helicase Mcm
MNKDDIIEKFVDFLNEFYYSDMISAVSENRKSITIDFANVDRFDTELADYILENPGEALTLAEEATAKIDLQADTKLKIRFINLPESRRIRIRNIRAEHIEKMICVDGIVKRASEVRPEVLEAIFTCPECGTQLSVLQTEIFLKYPIECPQCENRKGFKQIGQKLYDARWIVIEEPFEITSGERPSDIRIFLKEDLTTPRMQNKTEPGNRINVVGVLKQLPRRVKGGASRQMEIYIDANSIENLEMEWEELEITSEDEKKIIELTNDPEIYTKLVQSVAPALYGMEEIKEAIVLQLFGGETHVQKDKSRVRGDMHILLVGDPSCLVADERVVLSDGTIMKISEMGHDHLEKINYNVHLGMGRKVGKAEIFHFYKNQPIIEIITETGKSIKGTYNQPVLTVKNRKKLWKKIGRAHV